MRGATGFCRVGLSRAQGCYCCRGRARGISGCRPVQAPEKTLTPLEDTCSRGVYGSFPLEIHGAVRCYGS